MKLSILTATYNRAELLERLYMSIVNNIYYKLDIEWLIMDDGSNDNTEIVVRNFKDVQQLNIKYFKQINQGKMQAINNLMQYVTGDLVMDCDSDDFFVNNAFEEIYNKSNELLDDDTVYALMFLKNEKKDNVSGNLFKIENQKTTLFDLHYKDAITGEKVMVFKSSIRKQYKHELEQDEKFVTEARMYYKMDLKYSVKCYNISIVEGEYLDSGYTNNILKTFVKYPNGYYNYFKEILARKMSNVKLNKRLYAIKHYILFEYITKSKISVSNIRDAFNKILYIILFIPGKIKSRKFLSKELALQKR